MLFQGISEAAAPVAIYQCRVANSPYSRGRLLIFNPTSGHVPGLVTKAECKMAVLIAEKQLANGIQR